MKKGGTTVCFVMIASLGWRGFFGLNTFDSAAGALAPRVSLIYLEHAGYVE